MSVNLRELFQRNGFEFLDEPLKRAQNAPGLMLADDAWFTNTVVAQAWEHAPLQFRLAGREPLEFDRFLIEAKPQLYVEIDERIRLRLDWKDQMRAAIEELPVAEATLPEVGQPEAEDYPTSPPAVGIDLGTTYSVVAYMDGAGRPTTIVNAVGELLTPSVVLFDTDGPVVGKEAVNGSVLEPHKVAECVKRDMGKKGYRKPINGEVLPPEVISSLILRKLRSDAERKLGPIRKAVVTVPAYFDEPRRQATADAGEMAGLDVLDILNEPTAAAIAFGYQEGLLDRSGETTGGRPIRVLVYDLGGGTFDVSIVEIAAGSFQVVATDGDVYLGGKDWDERLAGIVSERFKQVHGSDPRSTPESRQELFIAVESAKRTLSERPRAVVVAGHEGKKLKLEVTREEFEDATAALVARTRTTAEIVMMQAKLKWEDLDRVLLVGGSTRMPMIGRMLTDLSGKNPDRSLSPDEAVAHGAALYADMLLQKRGITEGHTDFTVGNVNSHSLGVVAIDSVSKRRVNRILVAKNTRLPSVVRMRFKTHRDNQKSVSIQVLEGESELPEACTQVGECVIRDLPSKLPAGWPIEVRYAYDESGRLKVTGELVGHGAKVVSEFVRDNTLPPDDLMLWAQLLEPVEELEF